MIVSSLYPRFRDLAIIWTVLSTVLFYASPVLYPLDKVPGTLRDIIMLNPLAPLLEGLLVGAWAMSATGSMLPMALAASACLMLTAPLVAASSRPPPSAADRRVALL